MAIDNSRQSEGVVLPTEISDEIWAKTVDESAVMRLATRTRLPGRGLTIPVVTGDPEPAWVNETDEKPVGKHTYSSKNMQGYTMAIIEPFSKQFRRDLPALYNELVARLPRLLARKFDSTVFFGEAPGSNFDTLASAQAVNIATNTYEGLVDAKLKVAEADGQINGWAMSPQAEGILLKATDTAKRPLFIANAATEGGVSRLLSQPVYEVKAAYKAGTPNVIGIAGDWGQARYGIVDDITVDISDQASLTVADGDSTKQLNLWQRNMFAVRVEFEIGFVVRDVATFVRLTDAAK